MANYNNILFLIKKAAVEAVEAGKPVAVMFGTVSETSPIQVIVEQKLTLSSRQLIVGEKVAETLAVGDEVIVLRMQGGQRFLVLDRVAN